MQMVQLHDNTSLIKQVLPLYAAWASAHDLHMSETSVKDMQSRLEKKLHHPGLRFFVFKNQQDYIGFAEVALESECFPDEDLP